MSIKPEITNQQIMTLSHEAETAGDTAQVAICKRALFGDVAARAECVRVIAAAAALDTCETCGTLDSLHDHDDDGNALPCNVAPDGSIYSRGQLDAMRRGR